MSKARDLADLLDSSGDVKSAKLDNVPTYSDVTDTASGLMKKDHKIKLAGIETGATGDQTKADIEALDIELPAANLTGTVADARISTLTSSKLTGALPAIDGSSLTGVQPFPSGTVMVFYQASAPTGWTKSTSQNNKALRVVSGTGGGSGGSWDLSSGDTSSSTGAHTHTGPSHTHSTPSHSHSHSLSAGSHTLSTSQMPSHNHSIGFGDRATGYNSAGKYANPNSSYSSGSAGSSSSHSHSLSGSISSGGSGTSGSGGTGNTSSNGSHTHTISAPKYIDVIVCSKD